MAGLGSGSGKPEVSGSQQVPLTSLSLGRFGLPDEGARLSRVNAFRILFCGGGRAKFFFSFLEIRVAAPHHVSGSSHLPYLLPHKLTGASDSGGHRWTSDAAGPGWPPCLLLLHQRALRHNPEGEIQRKSPAPFECVFFFPLPPAPPSSSTFLSKPSLFMIAWITEEEILRLLKETCKTKLMNK